MSTRARTAVQAVKAVPKLDQVKEMEKEKKTEPQGSRLMDAAKAQNRSLSRRETKIALQQDVDKLRKKLRHEENVHRALERAFTRPLGALPRLPPYLPSHTLELLAEVAVLEEEVVRLEEQVVNFWQGLYKEAIYVSSSSKKAVENTADLYLDRCQSLYKSHSQLSNSEALISSNPSASMRWCSDADLNEPSSNRFSNVKQSSKKLVPEDQRGKENQPNVNSTRTNKQSPLKKGPRTNTPIPNEKPLHAKGIDRERLQESFHGALDAVLEESSSPNKLSEDILKCLMSIFLRISSQKNTALEVEMPPSVLGSSESSEDGHFRDPYGICSEFGKRDIGPYKNLCAVEVSSSDRNLVTGSSLLSRRLKGLLRKLALVELSGLSHHQKLAFWINIYNSCMMNAFLEQGIPYRPDMVVAMMPRAMINVGGYLLSAMTIEHFILRLPYHPKYTYQKGVKSDDVATRGVFGLDWPEPMVTFALSYGSWSSPVVRVYTASQVDKELDAAKRDYLQASVGISTSNKLAIPKLLDWYLLDFAKDVESLMDWICLQLPSELRNEAVQCLEMGRRNLASEPVQILPYDFSFRYLLAP